MDLGGPSQPAVMDVASFNHMAQATVGQVFFNSCGLTLLVVWLLKRDASRSSRWESLVIVLMLISNLTNGIVQYTALSRYLEQPSQIPTLPAVPWTKPVGSLLSSISCALAQAYYVVIVTRVLNLSRKYRVLGWCFTFSTLSIAFVFPCYYLRRPTAIRHRGFPLVALAVYVSIARATQDLIVAGLISYKFFQVSRRLKTVRGGGNILRHCTLRFVLAFELSFFTATWSLLVLLTYLCSRQNDLHTVFVFSSGSVSFLSLIISLLSRNDLQSLVIRPAETEDPNRCTTVAGAVSKCYGIEIGELPALGEDLEPGIVRPRHLRLPCDEMRAATRGARTDGAYDDGIFPPCQVLPELRRLGIGREQERRWRGSLPSPVTSTGALDDLCIFEGRDTGRSTGCRRCMRSATVTERPAPGMIFSPGTTLVDSIDMRAAKSALSISPFAYMGDPKSPLSDASEPAPASDDTPALASFFASEPGPSVRRPRWAFFRLPSGGGK